MQTNTYILPAYWAPYLINDDSSGMDDQEKLMVDQWLAGNPNLRVIGCSSESYFSHSNDSDNGLAGDVLEYTVTFKE